MLKPFFPLPKQDVRELKDQRDLLEFELEEMSQLSVSLHWSKFRVLQIITVEGTSNATICLLFLLYCACPVSINATRNES